MASLAYRYDAVKPHLIEMVALEDLHSNHPKRGFIRTGRRIGSNVPDAVKRVSPCWKLGR
jgi:hypothetical protein